MRPTGWGARPMGPSWLVRSMVAATGLMFALFTGLLIAVASVWGAALLAGVMLMVAALMLPWGWLLALLLLAVFVVVGPLQYVGGVGKAFWIPYGMAALMGLRLAVEAPHRAQAARGCPTPSVPAARLWRLGLLALAVFGVTALVSSLLHLITPMQGLTGGKEILLLSLPLAFGAGALKLPVLRASWRWAALWLFLQLPVVVWQRYGVAPRRGGDSPWDAVVGLFAGQAWGGGGSGTMALVSLWAAALVVMAWRARQASGPWAVASVLAAGAACAWAEAKVALVLLPLLALLAAAPVAGRPAAGWGAWRAAVGLTVAGGLLSSALLLALQAQFTSSREAQGRSVVQYLDTVTARNLDDAVLADPHGQLTRLGALRWWWQRQSLSDVPGWLVGHGLGASRRSLTTVGEVARAQRFDVARSSATILLWETGVLGLSSLTLGLAAIAACAWRWRRHPALRDQAWLLQAAAAIVLLGLLSLPYGADLHAAPQWPVALLMGVGVTAAAHRALSGRIPATQEDPT